MRHQCWCHSQPWRPPTATVIHQDNELLTLSLGQMSDDIVDIGHWFHDIDSQPTIRRQHLEYAIGSFIVSLVHLHISETKQRRQMLHLKQSVIILYNCGYCILTISWCTLLMDFKIYSAADCCKSLSSSLSLSVLMMIGFFSFPPTYNRVYQLL